MRSGGLAGAVGADQSEDLAAGDLQVQVVHGRQFVEAPGEVLGANDPFHQFPVRISASAGMLDFSSWRRVIDIDLDAINQLHPLFGGLDLLGRELGIRGDERDVPVVDLVGNESVVTLTLSPSLTRPRSCSRM
jgi:hypothetical protein